MAHLVHTYFLSLDLNGILRDFFGFDDGKMPASLFRNLPSDVRSLINSAKCDDGRIVNGFLIVVPQKEMRNAMRERLLQSLITPKRQSNSVHLISLTSQGPLTAGDICLVMPDKIFTQSKQDSDSAKERIMTKKSGTSQYSSGPRGCILLGMGEILDWKLHNVQCSFKRENMQLPMEQFCDFLCSDWGAIPLVISEKCFMTVSKE